MLMLRTAKERGGIEAEPLLLSLSLSGYSQRWEMARELQSHKPALELEALVVCIRQLCRCKQRKSEVGPTFKGYYKGGRASAGWKNLRTAERTCACTNMTSGSRLDCNCQQSG